MNDNKCTDKHNNERISISNPTRKTTCAVDNLIYYTFPLDGSDLFSELSASSAGNPYGLIKK